MPLIYCWLHVETWKLLVTLFGGFHLHIDLIRRVTIFTSTIFRLKKCVFIKYKHQKRAKTSDYTYELDFFLEIQNSAKYSDIIN